MDRISSWFNKEVFMWRTCTSSIWTSILIPFILNIYWLDFSSFRLFTPLSWLNGWVAQIFSVNLWLRICLICIIFSVASYFHASQLTVRLDVKTRRIAHFHRLFNMRCALHACLFAMVGVTACYAILTGGHLGYLQMKCYQDIREHMCLNEHFLFVVCFSAFLGASYGWTYIYEDRNYLKFPTTVLPCRMRCRTAIVPTIRATVRRVILHTLIFYILYGIFGNFVKHVVAYSFNLPINTEVAPLSSLSALLDVRLFFCIVKMGSVILVVWEISRVFLHTFNSMPYQFSIKPVAEKDAAKCYTNALAASDPLVQHLAFLDMCQISRHDEVRRSQIFTRSSAEARVCWASMWEQSSKLIDTLTTDIHKFAETVYSRQQATLAATGHSIAAATTTLLTANGTPVAVTPGGISDVRKRVAVATPLTPGRTHIRSSLNTSAAAANNSTFSVYSSAAGRGIGDSSIAWQNSQHSGMTPGTGGLMNHWQDRSVTECEICQTSRTFNTDESRQGDESQAATPSPNVSLCKDLCSKQSNNNMYWTLSWWMHRTLINFNPLYLGPRLTGPPLEELLRRYNLQWKLYAGSLPTVKYFVDEKAVELSYQVLSCQLYACAVEGISRFVSVSASEDDFGVVQRDLREVVIKFFNLHSALEKHGRDVPNLLSRRPYDRNTHGASALQEFSTRTAITAIVNSAIYRIVLAFEKDLLSLPFSGEHRQKLKTFLDFRQV